MKLNYITIILLLIFTYGFTQPATLVTNARDRQKVSLNGQWRIIIDPYENGYYNYRYQPKTSGGYFDNQTQTDKSQLLEYNFATSHTLQVPGDWNSQINELFYYEGTVWYQKDFEYVKSNGRRIFIYFGAANYHAIVYINGEKVGEHTGGFTPFNFEITEQVNSGANFVVVKVDNKRIRSGIPTVNTDWWNYGGLTRDVFLFETPDNFIEQFSVQLDNADRNTIKGWVQLNAPKKSQPVKISIAELDLEIAESTNNDGYVAFEAAASPVLWSPDNPQLYPIELTAGKDRVSDMIGFRTVNTKSTQVLLNGKALYLKGICIHEEAPIRGGRAFSRGDARILLNWVKELGGNFVRLAHYPHNEHMVRMAEEMGILVWEEIPVYWTILWDNPETFKLAEQQLEEMIRRDQNRANVIIWSVGNETPLSEQRLQFMSRLATRARELDHTRLISAALERHYIDSVTQMIDDPLGEYLDVIGCNEYIGWYDGLPTKISGIRWESEYDKPHIISEFGAGALQGLYADNMTRWSEEFQEYLYQEQVKMLDKVPFISGLTPWILMDFRSPRRPLPGIQDNWNRKGIISERGQKKKAFFVLKNYYQNK